MTSDPTQVTNTFFDSGYDVVISGIDTTEATIVAKQKKMAKKDVYAIPYDYKNACEGVSDICLGVPYFNWGPSYVSLIGQAMESTLKQQWIWLDPDWKDLNNPDTSHVGFLQGPALSDTAAKALDQFISDLGAGTVKLFKGPLNYQDGSPYLKDGEAATDRKIWYMEQLLEGMKGQSKVK